MIKWCKKWGLPVLVVLVLVTGIGLQVLSGLQPVPEGTLDRPLSDILPKEYPGWVVQSLDLGPTESVVERSQNILKLDDFVHREYARGKTVFSVYVAYWKPGKMPVRLVNQHTPDRCWTEVGWTCTDRKWDLRFTVDGLDLQPGQWGIYEKGDYANHTYFWHIVGGEVHWYGGKRMNTRTSINSVLADFRKFGLNVHREQFFIRIVSPGPMDALWKEPLFKQIMGNLADLCLAEPVDLGEAVSH